MRISSRRSSALAAVAAFGEGDGADRDLGGEQLIEWGGALRWLAAGPRTDTGEVRASAQGNGGHATLFRATDKSPGAFHPLPEAIHSCIGASRRLWIRRDVNRGRLYPDF